MFCSKCGNKLADNTKFCVKCGFLVSENSDKKVEQVDPKKLGNNNTSPIDNSNHLRCQICGALAPVKYVEFQANIGMLIVRRRRYIKGNMCKDCININFKRYILINLFLGWWGVISFFATIVFLITDTAYYLGAVSLKKHY